MIRNLGRVLSVLVMQEAGEHFAHADVDAWHAPSECHRDVARGAEKRARKARKQAEALARRPLRVIMKEARARGFNAERALSRVYSRNFPF